MRACVLNCEAIELGDRLFIHAIAAIEAGEELFIDYGLAADGEVTEDVRALGGARAGNRSL